MTKRVYKKWTIEEVSDLKKFYPDKDKEWLQEYFGRKWKSITDKASKEKIRKSKGNEGLEILLDNSIQSMYWIGFLLADGHVAEDRLSVELSTKDKTQLEKFARYIKTSNWYERERLLNGKTYYQNSVAVHNNAVIPKIRKIFDINNNKTKNPPSIKDYKLSDTQLISLFIGFIDGDGSIYVPSYTEKLRIECDKQWYENLLFFENLIYKKFEHTKNVEQLTKISSRNSAVLEVSSASLLRKLKKFIIDNKIVVMDRKWDLVKNSV